MGKNIYIREEFLARANISETILAGWEKAKLVKPVGYTEDQIPFYTELTVEKVAHILKLQELGYSLEEIHKIIKKVGLPKPADGTSENAALDQYITVGSLAEGVGVSPRTIKHWEDKGIIEPDMRSEGGFRLYPKIYIFLCKLIKDLQLFGYTLEEIKVISDYFRDFLSIQRHLESNSSVEVSQKLNAMLNEIQLLFDKMNLLKEGIQRWEDLLKKKKREILNIRNQIDKRLTGDKNE